MKNKKDNDPFKAFFDSLFNRSNFFEQNFISIRTTFDSGLSFPEDGDENYNKTEETSETETHVIKREIWTSIDGKNSFERTTSESKRKGELKPSKAQLEIELNTAIKNQEYEKACTIRDQIKLLK